MSEWTVISTEAITDLKAEPVSQDWILNGSPEMRCRELVRSRDQTAYTVIWDCTAGRFNWHYSKDETLVVLSGEAFITEGKDGERRIGPGDVVFFPAGSSATWNVPNYIRKVAFLRHTMPRPLGFGVRAWSVLRRIVGGRSGGL